MPNMPSTKTTAESTNYYRSIRRRIKSWKARIRNTDAEEEGPIVEPRHGSLNQDRDVRDGQFADSVLRSMHHRGYLRTPQAEVSGPRPQTVQTVQTVQTSHPRGVEQERELVEEHDRRHAQELSKKHKRGLNLSPGGEAIAVTLYRLACRLVHSQCDKCNCTSQSKYNHRHDSSISQSTRLFNGDRASS